MSNNLNTLAETMSSPSFSELNDNGLYLIEIHNLLSDMLNNLEEKEENNKNIIKQKKKYCEICKKVYLNLTSLQVNKHRSFCKGKESIFINDYIFKIPKETKLDKIYYCKNVKINRNFIDEVDFNNLNIIFNHQIDNFNDWFIFNNKNYMKTFTSKFSNELNYTFKLRKFLDDVSFTEGSENYNKFHKNINNVNKLNIVNVINMLLITNHNIKKPNITIYDVEKILKDYPEQEKFYYDKFNLSQKTHDFPENFTNWQPKTGMLMVNYKFRELPLPFKEIGNKLKQNLNNIEIGKVTLVIKTKGFYSPWHMDLVDEPGFALIYQLIGNSIFFSSYGLLPAYFIKVRNLQTHSEEDLIKTYYQAHTKYKKKYKRYCVLKEGEVLLIPACIFHEVHVPDCDKNDVVNNESSLLLAFMIKLNGIDSKLKDINFPFDVNKENSGNKSKRKIISQNKSKRQTKKTKKTNNLAESVQSSTSKTKTVISKRGRKTNTVSYTENVDDEGNIL